MRKLFRSFHVVIAGLILLASQNGFLVADAKTTEPPATPRAHCGPGSRPETGIQGRVSQKDVDSGRALKGFMCNTKIVGHYGESTETGSGGYRVYRYIDRAGHECAYYDTTLLWPTSAQAGSNGSGVYVLDMKDPAKPVKTDNLLTPAMQSPHESVSFSPRRGLLAAVLANPVFYPGIVDVYDVSADCRHPVLKSSTPSAQFGHEGALSPDGRTYYATGLSSKTVDAIDLTDPSLPQRLWSADDMRIHGLSISDDGNRAYMADTGDKPGLVILDVSQINKRVPNPQVREVSRLTWKPLSTPQTTIPVTIKGHRYLIEIDEFDESSIVGAARIIDIGDERKPRQISDIRLEVNMLKYWASERDDPDADNTLGGYTGHYCSVPQRKDPGIVACSFILSGLRVFDIRDPFHPKEIAYFNAPRVPTLLHTVSNYAMSGPAFAPERGEIWYTDGNLGFFNVKVTNGVWPFKK